MAKKANAPKRQIGWQVGAYLDPQKDDPWFDFLDDAIEDARSRSRADHGGVYAVWDQKTKLVWVFICGQTFREAA